MKPRGLLEYLEEIIGSEQYIELIQNEKEKYEQISKERQ